LTKESVIKNQVKRENYFGVCTVRIYSTELLHKIYGAIQKYSDPSGIMKYKWLSGKEPTIE